MTPQEKADELVKKMYKVMSDSVSDVTLYFSKQCALIAVDEMIRITPWGGDIDNEIEDGSKEFYMKVKQEIENI
jgi:hypothetical protein